MNINHTLAEPNIILDYDGTLHDARRIYEPAFRDTMHEIADLGWIEREEYSTDEINYWIGFSAKEMWERFHPELEAAKQSYAGRRIGERMKELVTRGGASLYPGAEEALDRLHKHYTLYFLSNCMSDYAAVHRKAFGLDRWFEHFYCTGDYGFRQKEAVFSEHIYEEGSSYIAVGDRIKDITLASSCGLKSIGCLYGFGTKEELKQADILVDDISKLPEAVSFLSRKDNI